MRLDKYLADSGVGTRKEIKAIVRSGAVTVDGVAVCNPSFYVNEGKAAVCINGTPVQYKKYIYIMMNKPDGYVSATFDKRLPVVTDLLDEYSLGFEPFPAGRLDIDTEGMLILTNDGELCHRILSPKNHIHKKYLVNSDLPVTDEDIAAFESGITLDDGYECMPALLEYGEDENTSFVTICEGKFHQVKRMFEAVGKRVIYLKRVSMGNLPLDEALPKGAYRELSDEEIKKLEEK